MLKFDFSITKGQPLKILCIGAHSDDIEIGCGGTILRLLSERADAQVLWVVLGATGQRHDEAVASANRILAGAKSREIIIKGFKDGYFPYIGGDIKNYFEEMKRTAAPDVIFTHYRNDLHQDHRLLSELTWNTFRDHLILEYEVMKYDGDMGSPNFYVYLDKRTCQNKIALIMESFRTQAGQHWFNEDAFSALLKLRGIECNSPEGYAEGFYCRKVVI